MGGGTDLPAPKSPIEILILGAGWTSTFLIPLLQERKITYAATTTSGRDGTHKFSFDPDSSEEEMRKELGRLPTARNVLITFPLKGKGQSGQLVGGYVRTHSLEGEGEGEEQTGEEKGKEKQNNFHFLQLGSTGIWTIPGQPTWVTRKSPYNKSDERAIAEDELLALGGCVLNLSGLWGGERQVKHWIDRVAGSKEMLGGKKTLHMVHGKDVARGIVGAFERWERTGGERWVGFVFLFFSFSFPEGFFFFFKGEKGGGFLLAWKCKSSGAGDGEGQRIDANENSRC
ncbi:hypothetical protein ACMFMG_007932 [Clarireedia jacksonii]